MTTTTHTPGPWHLKTRHVDNGNECPPGTEYKIFAPFNEADAREAEKNGYGVAESIKADYHLVGEGYGNEANARLLVAAPELLDMLKDVRRTMELDRSSYNPAYLDKIDAVIAKAA